MRCDVKNGMLLYSLQLVWNNIVCCFGTYAKQSRITKTIKEHGTGALNHVQQMVKHLNYLQ